MRWRALRLAALSEAPYAFGSKLEDALGFSDSEWQAQMDRGPYLVAHEEEVDLGVLRLAVGEDPQTYWLYSLWIAPRARGTGLLTRFLSEAENVAVDLGARQLYLDVTHDNERALSAYLRNGFEPVKEKPADGAADEITMVKLLVTRDL